MREQGADRRRVQNASHPVDVYNPQVFKYNLPIVGVEHRRDMTAPVGLACARVPTSVVGYCLRQYKQM